MEWTNNLESLLCILEAAQVKHYLSPREVSTTCAQGGVRGVVTDADTGAGLAGAEVEVEDRAEKVVTSSARGEFWRLLLPGTYTLRSVLE